VANRKISAFPLLAAGDAVIADDYLPVIDASVADADKNKRMTLTALATALGVGTPADGSVTTAKIADSAVTHAKVTYNPGQMIQSVYAEVTDVNSASANIPLDDTIPQSNEGIEFITATITPKFSTSKLRVRFQGWGMNSTGGHTLIVAFFRDSGVNAVAAGGCHAPELTANFSGNIQLEHQETAGSTSATTFKVRVGPTGGIMALNGSVGARKFGGVSKSTLVIEEVAG
jgi:hypothetical protein